jgi:hypothetical protein
MQSDAKSEEDYKEELDYRSEKGDKVGIGGAFSYVLYILWAGVLVAGFFFFLFE